MRFIYLGVDPCGLHCVEANVRKSFLDDFFLIGERKEEMSSFSEGSPVLRKLDVAYEGPLEAEARFGVIGLE